MGRVLYGTELGSVTLKINNQQRESLMYAGIGCTADIPFLDWNAEFRFAESRFSQPLYQ